jgi:hypothetical protein
MNVVVACFGGHLSNFGTRDTGHVSGLIPPLNGPRPGREHSRPRKVTPFAGFVGAPKLVDHLVGARERTKRETASGDLKSELVGWEPVCVMSSALPDTAGISDRMTSRNKLSVQQLRNLCNRKQTFGFHLVAGWRGSCSACVPCLVRGL